MPSNTSYAQLYLYNNTTDKETLFSEFRERLAGTAETSNMQKIDALLSQDNTRITNLENSPSVLTAKATTSDAGNNFVVTIENFTEYKQDMIMVIYLSQNNVGLTTININNIGTKSLMKIGSNGTATNLEANDLKKNVGYLFQYDGTQFVLLQEKTFETLDKTYLSFEEVGTDIIPPTPVDADTLGGISSSEYTTKTYLSNQLNNYSTKTYVSEQIQSITSENISFDNAETELSSTNVEGAIKEVYGDLLSSNQELQTTKSTAENANTLAQSALPKSGGTMTGDLIAMSTDPATSSVRNIYAGTEDLEAGVSELTTGAIYLVYE